MNAVKELNIKQLFSSGEYVIPIYQRNYAWTEREIAQLIQDIADYAAKHPEQAYYIGTLVVYERAVNGRTIYETIDGQQRLTTLNLLMSVIKSSNAVKHPCVSEVRDWYKMNLSFDSRPSSNDTLQRLYEYPTQVKTLPRVNVEIGQGYDDAAKLIWKVLYDSGIDLAAFVTYLSEKVHILRVSVPPDTDLNHYFEIMNNRGEQLEKHEVLKAQCLELLKDEPEAEYAFNKIWEACANMERYIQYGFDVALRDVIFGAGNWNALQHNDFDSVAVALKQLQKDGSPRVSNGMAFADLLAPSSRITPNDTKTEIDGQERFTSVINFSNFLLHILRIQTKTDIPLDDKGLIETFDEYIKKDKSGDPKLFVKEFGYNLLKSKFLFDKYILKREYLNGTDGWSLKEMRWYKGNAANYVNTFDKEEAAGDGQAILMLLAMFHVSTPTLVYKHWLNGVLKYVFEQEQVKPAAYRTFLETLANAFLIDRYLGVEQKSYFDIIYRHSGVPQNTEAVEQRLNDGTSVENFIFNYLDYLLWKRKEKGYERFVYTFRSSVEHYYPQDPIEGNPTIERHYLDNFGNLCLISGSQNSRLSNYMPRAKKDHYANSSIVESLKQQVMMRYEKWGTDEITKHGEEMKKLLIPERSDTKGQQLTVADMLTLNII